MSAMLFQQVIQLADQLTQAERAALIAHLQRSTSSLARPPLTRDDMLAEHERRKAAGASENAESLYGRYATPNTKEMTAEELSHYLSEIGTQWEKELDEVND